MMNRHLASYPSVCVYVYVCVSVVDVQKCWGLESFRPQCAAVWLCAGMPWSLLVGNVGNNSVLQCCDA